MPHDTSKQTAQALAARQRLDQALAAQRFADAVRLCEDLLSVPSRDPQILNLYGQALNGSGRSSEAVAALEEAVTLRPDFTDANVNLGVALMNAGRLEEALVYHRKAIAADGSLPAPHYNLAVTLLRLERCEEAVAAFEKVLALRPDFVGALNNMGSALYKLGRPELALRYYERAAALAPGNASAQYNCATALVALQRHEEAALRYKKALAINPNYAQAHAGLGNTHFYRGAVDEARRAYERAIALSPHTPAYYRLLTQAKTFTAGDPVIAALESMAKEETSYSHSDQVELHFALAKLYADLGQAERGFSHLAKGNALKRALLPYDEAGALEEMHHAAQIFTPALILAKQGLGDPSDVPVFIVGMPRSGTTLVEQILASHPQVFGGGELSAFDDALGEISAAGPFDARTADESDFQRLGARYLAKLLPMAPGAKRITDKLPGNFRAAGLIHLALPKARIIHVRRDPLDTCFSCYSMLFQDGLEFSYELGELGRYYKAYAALMDHWRAVLPQEAMLEIQYEDLVGNIETGARRLVEFCALSWDERCLRFHETKRGVQTASSLQVRQPLFSSAIGRWRPYAAGLGPLRAALESS